jgi:hypothetical protein
LKEKVTDGNCPWWLITVGALRDSNRGHGAERSYSPTVVHINFI